MIAFAKNQPLGPDDEERKRQELQESIFPVDKAMMESSERMNRLLTDEISETVRRKCKDTQKPFIDPAYYYDFMLGWNRTDETTAESVVTQCENSKEPENVIVAFSVYKSVLQEYSNKMMYLQRIFTRSREVPTLPHIDENALQEAGLALDDFVAAYPVEDLLQKCTTAERQRLMLSQYVGILRDHVWPKIQAAAQPVREAGNYVLKVAFELLGHKNT